MLNYACDCPPSRPIKPSDACEYKCKMLIRFRRGKRSDTVSKVHISLGCLFSHVRLAVNPSRQARQMALRVMLTPFSRACYPTSSNQNYQGRVGNYSNTNSILEAKGYGMSEPSLSPCEDGALSFALGLRRLDPHLVKQIAQGRSGSCTQGLPYQSVTTSFLQTSR